MLELTQVHNKGILLSARYTSYRERIYERYSSLFQTDLQTLDIATVRRWGRAYRYYLHGWLPENHEASILDIACGRGRLLQFFLDAGYHEVHGVDLSAEQVALARAVTPNVVHSDALQYLSKHKCRFDLITGLDIIEHFQKDEALQFLELCFNSLKPGGRLILQTVNAESPWGMHHRYNDLTHELGFAPFLLNRLLSLVGFHEIDARETGPVPLGYSAASTVRWCVWQVIRAFLRVWNISETGSPGSGVYTRIFLISGKRPL